ncbi:MAG: hypothetical protein VX498_03685 [Myxococcota bacterium]|nr:hypothetical protein [Myxococcota bacterium]
MTRLLLFLIGLSIPIGAHLIEGGVLNQFIRAEALVVSVLGPFLLGLALYRADLLRSPVAAWKGDPEAAGGVDRCIEVISGLRMLCISLGALGFALGVIGCISTLSRPDLLGPWVAMGLLSLVYSVTLSEIFLAPLLDRLAMHKLGGAEEGAKLEPAAAGHAWFIPDLLCLLIVVGLLWVTLAAMGARFFSMTALLLVLAPLPLAAGIHGVRVQVDAFRRSASPQGCTARQRARDALVLSSARTLLYATGTLGVVIGLITVFAHIDNAPKLGTGIAVAAFTALNAGILAELFVTPRIHRLQAAGGWGDGPIGQALGEAGRGRAPRRHCLLALTGVGLVVFLTATSLSDKPADFHETKCWNAIDDDKDGLIDCLDPDCLADSYRNCKPRPL